LRGGCATIAATIAFSNVRNHRNHRATSLKWARNHRATVRNHRSPIARNRAPVFY
jgi:hypothetical protein